MMAFRGSPCDWPPSPVPDTTRALGGLAGSTSQPRALGADGHRSRPHEPVVPPNASPVPVFAFGANVTALSVVRAFGRSRLAPIFLHAPMVDLACRSRWYRPIPGSRDGEPSARTLASFLEASAVERAVLIPCSDHWVDAVAQLPESLTSRFPVSLAPREATRAFLDKGELSALLTRVGVPHPRTVVPTCAEDLEQLPEEAYEHAFLKPRASQRFLDHYKVKALHVRGRADAATRFREVTAAGFQVLLQEYIPGPPTGHYFIDGFVDRAGVVRAKFARRRLRMYPEDFGNSTLMRSVPLAEVAPAIADLERLLAHTRYRGIFSAEVKLDVRDGLYKLLEVNVRPWWYLDFAEACGVPFCELYYRDALEQPLDDVKPTGHGPDGYDAGRLCAYPYFDFALYNSMRDRGLPWRPSLLSCAWSWMRAKQPIFAWDDPMPALTNFSFLVRRFVRYHILPFGK